MFISCGVLPPYLRYVTFQLHPLLRPTKGVVNVRFTSGWAPIVDTTLKDVPFLRLLISNRELCPLNWTGEYASYVCEEVDMVSPVEFKVRTADIDLSFIGYSPVVNCGRLARCSTRRLQFYFDP